MSIHDKDIKVGDIITTLQSGFYRVTGIDRRFIASSADPAGTETSSRVHYQQVATSSGDLVSKGPSKVKQSCYACHCAPARETIPELQKHVQKLRLLLISLGALSNTDDEQRAIW